MGYHGTSVRIAHTILRNPNALNWRISKGDHQWLGDGVYFFEDDPEAARWWARSIKGFSNWAVIEVQITVEEHELLNLVLEEHRRVLEEVLHGIAKRLEKSGNTAIAYRDAEAINLLCTKIAPQIKCVRAMFWGRPTKYNRIKLSRIRRGQIQLAVRPNGLSCISHARIVKEASA